MKLIKTISASYLTLSNTLKLIKFWSTFSFETLYFIFWHLDCYYGRTGAVYLERY